jgi:manganese/zinc/iron transport system permease protein
MDDLLRLLTLQDSNTRVVLLGTSILGIASAVIGTFAVLRKRSLVGDAVAHAALPGVCIAYFVVGDRNFAAFMLGALVFGIAAAAFVAFVRSATRIKEDAAIALAIGGFFGLGIVLTRSIQNQPSGNRAGLDSFIFGKAASMVGSDATLILIVAAAVLMTIALFYKEFKLLCFDRDFAASQGWPAMALDLLLMGLICTCTVVGLPAVGVVLMVSLLVIPAVAARFWTNRLSTMILIAAAVGGLSGVLGTALSATLPVPAGVTSRGWPTGPLITLVATAIFIASLLFAPRRGLIAEGVRRATLRRRVQEQNLLRAAFEFTETSGKDGRHWSIRELGVDPKPLARMIRSGLIQQHSHSLCSLTPLGQQAAAKVVRAHRLWELFLIQQAHIAPDHVDRDADLIEHVLPPEVLSELEDKLREMGRLPQGMPSSPHPLREGAKA